MIKTPLAVITAILCTGIAPCFLTVSNAADAPAPATAAKPAADLKTEMTDLMGKVQAKIGEGKKTEKDLADELKQLDAIIAEHKGEKTDEVAQVVLLKAQLYGQLFGDNAKAIEIIKTIKADYPDTKVGMNADRIIASIQKMAEADKAKEALKGTAFQDFDASVTDLDGKPLAVANYKGKVVLVDFWATWCGPCVGEMPNVIKAYQKYHDKGFEIIGVSLDQSKDKLTAFIKDNNMPWRQYFDGLGWENKVSTKYGIDSIPANYLIDKDGKIIDTGLRGEALDEAVGKALAQ